MFRNESCQLPQFAIFIFPFSMSFGHSTITHTVNFISTILIIAAMNFILS